MADVDPTDLWSSLDHARQPVPTCPSCGRTRCRTCGRSNSNQDFAAPRMRRQERDGDFDQIDRVVLFDTWAEMNGYDSVSRTYLNEDD
jgi:hypothetical protein